MNEHQQLEISIDSLTNMYKIIFSIYYTAIVLLACCYFT